LVLLESALILVALFSLVPMLWVSPRPLLYDIWLGLMLIAMVWVSARRLGRTRVAVEEAKRKRDEAARTGRPPGLN
jgi:hypothetical protein